MTKIGRSADDASVGFGRWVDESPDPGGYPGQFPCSLLAHEEQRQAGWINIGPHEFIGAEPIRLIGVTCDPFLK